MTILVAPTLNHGYLPICIVSDFLNSIKFNIFTSSTSGKDIHSFLVCKI